MKKLYLILIFLQVFILSAQNPADIAQTFGSYPGFNDQVRTICIQPDGKILVGGDFTSYQEQYANRIIRLNPDGTIDTSFNLGTGFSSKEYFYSPVTAICLQSDGKILVGGSFNFYQAQTQNYLIRLNPDGTKDNSFNIGDGFNKNVNTICLQPDGKILVGGGFTSFQGKVQNRLIRLNTDGTKDSTFNINNSGSADESYSGFSENVYTVCVQTDGKILVGGIFSAFNTSYHNKLIRLNQDGSQDNSFNTKIESGYSSVNGFNDAVSTIYTQPDGKILVAGYFTTYKGESHKGLVRLKSDGTTDDTFNVSLGSDYGVYTICVQPDGKLLLQDFDITKTENPCKIIRLNTDGSKDNTFLSNLDFSGGVYKIYLQPDGKILLGGNNFSSGMESLSDLIRLNPDGTKDTSLKTFTGLYSGFNGTIESICLQPDGKILVGGKFNTYRGQVQNKIIRLNENGTKDDSFIIGSGLNGDVRIIHIQLDGKILVAGNFNYYQDQSVNKLIRLNQDGSIDKTFEINTGFNTLSNYFITAIHLQPDGKILVGELFFNSQGQIQCNLIRLNSSGTKDDSFNIGSGFTMEGTYQPFVSTISLQSDGKILAGGQFSTFQGQPQNHLIRLNPDGSKDNSFEIGSGFVEKYSAHVSTINIQPDGKILVGGSFDTYQSQPYNRLVRLHTNGSIDSTFNGNTGFNGTVESICLQPDGKIFVGGYFNTFQGQKQNNIIRLNPDGNKDNSFNAVDGFYGYDGINYSYVSTICLKPDGKILVGGDFTSYKTTASSCLISLSGGSNLSTKKLETENKFTFYPNPVKDKIVISSAETCPIDLIEVYDLSGKKILKSAFKDNNLDVSDLNTGVYLMKVYNNGNCATHKFVKE